MTRRKWLLAGLSTAACSGPSPRLRLLTFPESYGHHLSIGQGFYQKEGITVDPLYFQSFPKMMEALVAGDGHVVTAYYDAILPLVADKRDIVAFLGLAKRPGSLLASLKAERVEQLAEATIGIPGPGSSSHHLLNVILRAHGLNPGEIKTAAIGVSAGAIAAVERGTVDAAMLTNLGYSTLKLRHRELRILADLRTPDGAQRYLASVEYPSLCLVARRSWLDANTDQAHRFARAFLAANRWMSNHAPEEIREALPAEARAADAEADIEAIRGMLPTLTTDGVISTAGMEAVLRVMRANVPRIAEAQIDVASTFHPVL
ncbi:MAG: ABC transporter substrate-binding protein [Acidobacteria bacterium]|nr:ABC transporter substrate-binding protein [Acidobacteriota bacterium]